MLREGNHNEPLEQGHDESKTYGARKSRSLGSARESGLAPLSAPGAVCYSIEKK